MNTSRTRIFACLFTLMALPALADEMPPPSAKKLSEIIQMLERMGYHPITEVSMDNGVWEIEAYLNQAPRELKVHPATGDIIADRPDH